jgi:hypothetical protein
VGSRCLSGLAKLLTNLHDEDTSSAEHVRRVLRESNQSSVSEMMRSFELPLLKGGTYTLHFVDPGLLLAALLQDSAALRDLYTAAWNRSPSSPDRPWSLVVAFDEFMPGNKLSTDQARKTMVLSFSFLELGGAYLSRGAVWCTPLVMRSAKIAEVHGQTLRVPHRWSTPSGTAARQQQRLCRSFVTASESLSPSGDSSASPV